MKRQSGVLLPVFSLPSRFGCGNFGEWAYKWIDRLSEGGFSYWQVLPFGITDGHNSPYMSYSSFAGNPYFIDPSQLYRKGLVTLEELKGEEIEEKYLCRYDILMEKRYAFFKKAAMRVKSRAEIEEFLSKNPHTAGSCLFLAKKQAKDGKIDEGDLFTHQFIQYEFHRQWQKLHSYANDRGIKIIGDIPFYVSEDSYDLHSAPELFMLDENKIPREVAGVPPDYFSEDGQYWGNPVYNWEEMEKDGYKRWRERLAYMLEMFDGVRIDHFRAISAYWSIPAGAKSAKEGRWVKGPGKKLIDAFETVSKGKLILAENLGIIDEDTDALLGYSGYPGMAVFQFGFDGNRASPHLPHNYERNLIAYTGTHDNNTMLGFIFELDEPTRVEVLEYLGNPADAVSAAVRTLLASRADTVIFPVQDLLGYGADTRVNTPGVAEGNWQYRISADQIDAIDWKKLNKMNKMYSR